VGEARACADAASSASRGRTGITTSETTSKPAVHHVRTGKYSDLADRVNNGLSLSFGGAALLPRSSRRARPGSEAIGALAWRLAELEERGDAFPDVLRQLDAQGLNPLRPRPRGDDRVLRGAEVSGPGGHQPRPRATEASQSTPRCRRQLGAL
jgi:hypothetical protein